jgi:hypothetical protein
MSAISYKDIPQLGGRQNRESMEGFVDRWLPLLGMHVWKVRIVWEKPIRGRHNAEILVSDKLKAAVIALNRDFETWSDYWAETTIIHELLHCLHKPVDLVWEKTTGITDLRNVDPGLHPALEGTAADTWETEMERFIDQLACRLYDLYHATSARKKS